MRRLLLLGWATLARLAAIGLLGITMAVLLLYAVTGAGLLRWLATGTALGTILAAVWYFIETGRNAVEVEAAFALAASERTEDDSPHPVEIMTDEGFSDGHLWSDDSGWHLEADGSRFSLDLPDGSTGADAELVLKDFVAAAMDDRGWYPRCCGTCSYFGHSNTSRRVSRGWVGYCLLHAQGPLVPGRDAVHLWHRCQDWEEPAA